MKTDNNVAIRSEKGYYELLVSAFDATRHFQRHNVNNLHKAAVALEKAGFGRYEYGNHVMLSMFYSPHAFFALGSPVFLLMDHIQDTAPPLRRCATVPRGIYSEMRDIVAHYGVHLELHYYNGWAKPLVLLE